MQKFDIYLNDMEDNQKENIRNIIQQCVNDGTSISLIIQFTQWRI